MPVDLPNNATQWRRVAALFVAGCSTAFHIGKVPVALPQLSADLGLSLLDSSWIVSIFSVLVGFLGIIVGLYAGRLNYRNAALAGLLLAALASIAGSQSTSFVPLLLSRSLEGLGWILAAVSIPPLLVSVSNDSDRPVVLGLWGAFMPAGVATAMLVAPPVLAAGDWPAMWQLAGFVSALSALLVLWAARGSVAPKTHFLSLKMAFSVIVRPAPLMVFGCFFVYSAQFLAVTSFMPILLLDKAGIDIQFAALLSALIVLANVMGNILSGVLLSHGVDRYRILVVALGGMLLLGVCVFLDQIALPLRILAAAGFTAVGGMIPGTLFASAPLMVRDLSQVGIITGLMLQAAGAGQMLGPLVLAGLVEWSHSWSTASLFTSMACMLGFLCAFRLRRVGVEHCD